MNVERGKFEGEPEPDEAELDARVAEAAMRDPRYAAHFAPERDAERLARGIADADAGRVVPHERVAEWLKTWGKPGRKPFPREWLA